jgi:hypothetical protein
MIDTIKYKIYEPYDVISNPWDLTGMSLNAVANCIGWRNKVTSFGDRYIVLLIKSEFHCLFTPLLHNRLLATFRRIFNLIIFLELKTPEDVVKERKATLKAYNKYMAAAAQKEADKLKKLKTE